MSGKDCEVIFLYGKGNRKAQRKRYKNNNKGVPKRDEAYLGIDGNYTYRPYKYCCYHKAFLTKNMAMRHNCDNRNCQNLKTLEWAFNKFEGDL